MSNRQTDNNRGSRRPSPFLGLRRFRSSGGRAGRGTTPFPPAYMYVPVLGASGMLLYCYYSCLDEAPFTKRKRLLATSPQLERQLGDQEYEKLLRQYRGKILPANHRATVTVRRVGSRIADAAQTFSREYPSSSGAGATMSKSPYTYTVVRSDAANAFVLPNNHVFVLTGLFKYARTEDELGAVLGHETAHNLARHAGEKMSRGILVSILARLSLLVDPSGVLYTIFLPAATLLGELPHSREAEVEADHIGLHLAAEACYDPRAAGRVFSAMKTEASGGGGGKSKSRGGKGEKAVVLNPPEFISTHPSYDSRLSNFDRWMPEAMAKFTADDGMRCRHVREEMKMARKRAAEAALRREELDLDAAARGRQEQQQYDPFRDEDDTQFRW